MTKFLRDMSGAAAVILFIASPVYPEAMSMFWTSLITAIILDFIYE